jgi:hypothetical protein
LILLQAVELTDDPTQRQQRCRALLDELQLPLLSGLMRVHADVTRVARSAHECLQQSNEAQALQAWLNAQSLISTDFPTLEPGAR